MDNLTSIRFHDPRRFGSILWQDNDSQLKLLSNLGPEPLSYEFNNEVLYNASIGKSKNIKTFIMDSKVVVGVGNIYASESLFLAGISPKRVSGKTSKNRYQTLTNSIKKILTDAINNGGTTLNDFSNVDGSPGYFSQVLSYMIVKICHVLDVMVKLKELFKTNEPPITAPNVRTSRS